MLTLQICDFENDVFIGLAFKKKKKRKFHLLSVPPRIAMGVLGKCCITKQNEFSILERMAKIKLLEKQRVCQETAVTCGRGAKTKSRGG